MSTRTRTNSNHGVRTQWDKCCNLPSFQCCSYVAGFQYYSPKIIVCSNNCVEYISYKTILHRQQQPPFWTTIVLVLSWSHFAIQSSSHQIRHGTIVAMSNYPFCHFLCHHCGIDLMFTQMLHDTNFVKSSKFWTCYLNLWEMEIMYPNLMPSQLNCLKGVSLPTPPKTMHHRLSNWWVMMLL